MSGSVNRAFITGRVGRDPEIRQSRSGDGIANLSIATSESWRDRRSGERVEKTEWHRVSVFNPKLVEVIEKYVKKGSLIYVEGKLQTRKWTGQDGVERVSTEIVLQTFDGVMTILASPPGGSADQPRQSAGDKQYAGQGSTMDDEIPF